MATLLLMPDSDSEWGWCRDGDPCHDENVLDCLRQKVTCDDHSLLRQNHMEGEITTAGTTTLSSTRAVAVCHLSGGYREQDTKSRDARKFHASISPSYIHQLFLSPGSMCAVLFMYSRLPLECFSRSRSR